MLVVHQLTKRFAHLTAVRDVNFELHPGEILGYLGPNGSGKSTTINMVVGLLEPTTGTITLNGLGLSEHPEAYKALVGYVPEEPHLYTHLTPYEYLSLVGQLRTLPQADLDRRIPRLLELFGLAEHRDIVMSRFSKGMRQRALLIAALLHYPSLLVLDEPFSGLDVTAAALLQKVLQQFVANAGMVLFSSHRFDIVQRLCRRVVVLDRGRVALCGDTQSISGAAPDALETAFARVTRQPDLAPIASAILDAVRS